MAITINTNVPSLNAQRNLNHSQNALNTAMQRLSSGLRINSAKDDAAGLAISDRMTSQIRGLNQAARNANDGISLAQTAEGALQESTNILQRMRELAVQSANDTNSASDRSSINDELVQLQEELDRIAETTEFNGRKLIDGSMAEDTTNKATFQVGSNAGVNQTISFGIDSAQGKDLSQVGTTIQAPNGDEETGTSLSSSTVTFAEGDLTVNGQSIVVENATAAMLAAAIDDVDGVTATASNTQAIDFAAIELETSTEIDEVGTTGNVVPGDSATGDSVAITGITDVAADSVTGIDISLDGGTTPFAIDWNAAGLESFSDWDDVTDAAGLETVLNAQTGLSANLDGETLTITAEPGADLHVGAGGAFTDGTDPVGSTGEVVAGDPATGDSVAITGITDVAAASVTGIDISLDGGTTPFAIDWNAAGLESFSGWVDVTDAAGLETVLNAQTGLSANLDGETLTITAEPGADLHVGAGGALTTEGIGEVGDTGGVVAGDPATGPSVAITEFDADAGGSVGGIDLSLDGSAFEINWGAEGLDDYTGWGDVENTASLVTVLNAQDGLAAAYDSETQTLTITADSGVALTVNAAENGALFSVSDPIVDGDYTVTLEVGELSYELSNENISSTGSTLTAEMVRDAINNLEAGFTATLTADGIEIFRADGESFTMSQTGTFEGGFTLEDNTGTEFNGQISLDSNSNIILTGDGLIDAGLNRVGIATTTIDQINVLERTDSVIAIASVDAAISKIDQIRGGLGAIQNRFESTIANLANVAENLSSARSRILDADIAQETSAMIKNNILQQAGVSILVQANQAPQMALSLLQ